MEEFLNDPQVAANEMVIEIEESDLGPVREMGIPVRLRRTPGGVNSRSPKLGEHTDEILKTLAGRSDIELAALREQGII